MWLTGYFKKLRLRRRLKELEKDKRFLFAGVNYHYNSDGELAAEFMKSLDKVKAEISRIEADLGST